MCVVSGNPAPRASARGARSAYRERARTSTLELELRDGDDRVTWRWRCVCARERRARETLRAPSGGSEREGSSEGGEGWNGHALRENSRTRSVPAWRTARQKETREQQGQATHTQPPAPRTVNLTSSTYVGALPYGSTAHSTEPTQRYMYKCVSPGVASAGIAATRVATRAARHPRRKGSGAAVPCRVSSSGYSSARLRLRPGSTPAQCMWNLTRASGARAAKSARLTTARGGRGRCDATHVCGRAVIRPALALAHLAPSCRVKAGRGAELGHA